MSKITTHLHQYVQHPNPAWSTHAACTICGAAVPKIHLNHKSVGWRVEDAQLSEDLKKELGR